MTVARTATRFTVLARVGELGIEALGGAEERLGHRGHVLVREPNIGAREERIARLHGLDPGGARGSVVDQDALIDLLGARRLAGAGLDVFADEPYVPTELCGLDNVVLLPHVGGATVRSLSMMRELVFRNLDQYLTDGTLTTPVVPTRSQVATA